MEVTREQRRAYIYARIRAAFELLAARKGFEFDFSASDRRISQRDSQATFDACNDAIERFINGECHAEEVQRAWIAYARAHQLREPEPLLLFGKESGDERTSELQPSKRKGRGRKRRGEEIREYKTDDTAAPTEPR